MKTTTLSAIKKELVAIERLIEDEERELLKTKQQDFNKRVEAYQRARKRNATIN